MSENRAQHPVLDGTTSLTQTDAIARRCALSRSILPGPGPVPAAVHGHVSRCGGAVRTVVSGYLQNETSARLGT